MQTIDNKETICQRIRINGVVQGVGFRPLVWRLAKELGLTGWVRNDSRGVEIEVCGKAAKVERLVQRLHQDAPPLAQIDAITSHFTDSVSVSEDFFILDSRGGRAATMIGQDTAVCRDCLGEMFDPESRRWRYALTNCGHCGPRYTICNGLPFDRERTSLKHFSMCNKCQAEYRRPQDRRLHAEANCCPKCGPHLTLLDAQGKPLHGDAIAQAYALLKNGKVLAIKGSGGFHLACDAHNPEAVALLRARKKQPLQPFPVMFANALSATTYVQFSVGEPGLLSLPERSIILLKKRKSCDSRLLGVASGFPWLGVSLPSSPVHYLLFHEAAKRPTGLDWLEKTQDFALVMSGGNPGHEPAAIENNEAVQRLSGIADAFLVHNRDIVTRCDDSIACSAPGGLHLIRRSRGYAPKAVKLAQAGPPILAVGGSVKNTICITRSNEAFVSQHIGDLSNPASLAFFEQTIAHLLRMLEVNPTLIAHDLRRDAFSSDLISEMALQRGVPLLAVQHHHAHVAAVLAEHGITESTLCLALDGGGRGTDGNIWGGELLRVNGARFERLAHLLPLQLISEDVGARTPWRMAASVLHSLGRGGEIAGRFADQPEAAQFTEHLACAEKCLASSSLGHLFDAAAGLLGINCTQLSGNQPGLLLEGMAEHFGETEPLSDGWKISEGQLDLFPLLSFLVEEKDAERGAAVFHATVAAALAEWVRLITPGTTRIAAGGGCLQNLVLARELRYRLERNGMQLIEARRIPPNDGGLSLGQAWVAQQYLLGSAANDSSSML